MEVRLTDKQKRFAEEYLADLNATQAAIRAGYGKKSASSVGSEMLNNPDISQYVAYLKYERSKKVECTSEMVLKELMKIGFSSISDLKVDWDELKGWDDVPEEVKHVIQEVETTVISKDDHVVTTKTKLKLHSKVDALEKIAKHIGFYEKHNEQKTGDVKALVITPASELKKKD